MLKRGKPSQTQTQARAFTQTVTRVQVHVAAGRAPNTFLEGFVDVDLARSKVLVVLHVREDAPLVDPVVVM